ncbi:MAG: hypothetical protein V1744_06765, partial [Candidatus Altiarchaeota archaeon]
MPEVVADPKADAPPTSDTKDKVKPPETDRIELPVPKSGVKTSEVPKDTSADDTKKARERKRKRDEKKAEKLHGGTSKLKKVITALSLVVGLGAAAAAMAGFLVPGVAIASIVVASASGFVMGKEVRDAASQRYDSKHKRIVSDEDIERYRKALVEGGDQKTIDEGLERLASAIIAARSRFMTVDSLKDNELGRSIMSLAEVFGVKIEKDGKKGYIKFKNLAVGALVDKRFDIISPDAASVLFPPDEDASGRPKYDVTTHDALTTTFEKMALWFKENPDKDTKTWASADEEGNVISPPEEQLIFKIKDGVITLTRPASAGGETTPEGGIPPEITQPAIEISYKDGKMYSGDKEIERDTSHETSGISHDIQKKLNKSLDSSNRAHIWGVVGSGFLGAALMGGLSWGGKALSPILAQHEWAANEIWDSALHGGALAGTVGGIVGGLRSGIAEGKKGVVKGIIQGAATGALMGMIFGALAGWQRSAVEHRLQEQRLAEEASRQPVGQETPKPPPEHVEKPTQVDSEHTTKPLVAAGGAGAGIEESPTPTQLTISDGTVQSDGQVLQDLHGNAFNTGESGTNDLKFALQGGWNANTGELHTGVSAEGIARNFWLNQGDLIDKQSEWMRLHADIVDRIFSLHGGVHLSIGSDHQLFGSVSPEALQAVKDAATNGFQQPDGTFVNGIGTEGNLLDANYSTWNDCVYGDVVSQAGGQTELGSNSTIIKDAIEHVNQQMFSAIHPPGESTIPHWTELQPTPDVVTPHVTADCSHYLSASHAYHSILTGAPVDRNLLPDWNAHPQEAYNQSTVPQEFIKQFNDSAQGLLGGGAGDSPIPIVPSEEIKPPGPEVVDDSTDSTTDDSTVLQDLVNRFN